MFISPNATTYTYPSLLVYDSNGLVSSTYFSNDTIGSGNWYIMTNITQCSWGTNVTSVNQIGSFPPYPYPYNTCLCYAPGYYCPYVTFYPVDSLYGFNTWCNTIILQTLDNSTQYTFAFTNPLSNPERTASGYVVQTRNATTYNTTLYCISNMVYYNIQTVIPDNATTVYIDVPSLLPPGYSRSVFATPAITDTSAAPYLAFAWSTIGYDINMAVTWGTYGNNNLSNLWVAFGWNPLYNATDPTHPPDFGYEHGYNFGSWVPGGDGVVAALNSSNMGLAQDFWMGNELIIPSAAACATSNGTCADISLAPELNCQNNVVFISSNYTKYSGTTEIATVIFSRPILASDICDQTIPTGAPLWSRIAIGPIQTSTEVWPNNIAKHTYATQSTTTWYNPLVTFDTPMGCDNVPWSNTTYDVCGVCGGNNSTCTGCDGILWSNKTYDACGVCGGDNSTCLMCDMLPYASAGYANIPGTPSYLTISPNTAIPYGNTPITFLTYYWMNSNISPGGDVPIYSFGIAHCGNDEMVLYVSSALHLKIAGGCDTTPQTSSLIITKGMWNQIGFTYTPPNTVILYLNGQASSTFTFLFNISAAGCFRMGRTCDDTSQGFGFISRTRVWNTTLSPTQVGDEYIGNWQTQGLVDYWDGSGSTSGLNNYGVYSQQLLPTLNAKLTICKNTSIGCDGIYLSNKTYDSCGVCGGNNSTCAGCDGIPNSNKTYDACGVCGGNNSTCDGCDGIPYSGKKYDACGVCGGDNSSCMMCDMIPYGAAGYGTFSQGLIVENETLIPHGGNPVSILTYHYKPNTIGNDTQCIVQWGGSTAGTRFLVCINGGYVDIYANTHVYYNGNLHYSQWNQIGITFVNSTLSLYVNGGLVGTSTGQIMNIPSSGGCFQFASACDGGGPITGSYMTLMKMWNRALSSQEVSDEYNGIYHTNGLISYWDGSLTSNGRWQDVMTTANNGIYQNGSAIECNNMTVGCDAIPWSNKTYDACGVCAGDNSTCIGCDGVPASGKTYDACGVCGGNNSTCDGCDGIPYSNKTYDACGVCDGDNSTCTGCDGIVNSNKTYDGCGVCGGDNSTCGGCDHVPYSNKTYDACGVCDGNNSTCTGCDGIMYSNKTYDACGVCGGDNSTCKGCDGIPNSNKTYDACGVCDGNNSTCAGCDGIPNSNKTYDQCGVCNGNNSTCEGCDGIPNSNKTYDACGVCDGNNSTCDGCDHVPYSNKTYDACGVCDGNNSTCDGCDGIPYSNKTYDACGVCDGNNSTCDGCDGIPNSNKTYDACGVCDGNNSTCDGCDGIPNSNKTYDACGVCGGNNSTCKGCDGIPNSNKTYDACGVCGGTNYAYDSIPTIPPFGIEHTHIAWPIGDNITEIGGWVDNYNNMSTNIDNITVIIGSGSIYSDWNTTYESYGYYAAITLTLYEANYNGSTYAITGQPFLTYTINATVPWNYPYNGSCNMGWKGPDGVCYQYRPIQVTFDLRLYNPTLPASFIYGISWYYVSSDVPEYNMVIPLTTSAPLVGVNPGGNLISYVRSPVTSAYLDGGIGGLNILRPTYAFVEGYPLIKIYNSACEPLLTTGSITTGLITTGSSSSTSVTSSHSTTYSSSTISTSSTGTTESTTQTSTETSTGISGSTSTTTTGISGSGGGGNRTAAKAATYSVMVIVAAASVVVVGSFGYALVHQLCSNVGPRRYGRMKTY